jgi:hypothetical protein
MAEIRVGVTRISKGLEVDQVGDPGTEVFQHWVEINGVRHDTDDIGLLDVSYTLGTYQDPTQEQHSARRPGEVTIRLQCDGFSTVDHRTPAPG